MFVLNRLENETDFEYKLRLCNLKINKEIDNKWQDIVEILDIDVSADKLRHDAYAYAEYERYLETKTKENCSSALLEKINSKERELEQKKIQYRDERNAWQKQNAIAARVEQKLDYLEEQLQTIGKRNFSYNEFGDIFSTSENEMLIMCSDWHIGQCFDNAFGTYNSDIAFNRINKFIEEIKNYFTKYETGKAKIVLLGDMLSGSIHKSLQVTNRESVIDQIKLASELIANLCYKCSQIFNSVEVYSVAGNHSRLDRKEDALHDERLDDLIFWSVKNLLSNCDNVTFCENRDNGIAEFNMLGKKIVATHGDFEAHSKQGVSDLSFMLGYIPDYWVRGHYHSPSFNEFNGVTCIQGGSLSSTGDNYTLEKRITGSASQTICVFNEKGLMAHIPVKLS